MQETKYLSVLRPVRTLFWFWKKVRAAFLLPCSPQPGCRIFFFSQSSKETLPRRRLSCVLVPPPSSMCRPPSHTWTEGEASPIPATRLQGLRTSPGPSISQFRAFNTKLRIVSFFWLSTMWEIRLRHLPSFSPLLHAAQVSRTSGLIGKSELGRYRSNRTVLFWSHANPSCTAKKCLFFFLSIGCPAPLFSGPPYIERP